MELAAEDPVGIGFNTAEGICSRSIPKNVAWALLRRNIRLDGPLELLVTFGKCFPSNLIEFVIRFAASTLLPSPGFQR
jgi:hypothetical protein